MGDTRCKCVVTAKEDAKVVEGSSKTKAEVKAKAKANVKAEAKVKTKAKVGRCGPVAAYEGVVNANSKAEAKMKKKSKISNVVMQLFGGIVLAAATNVSMLP